VADLLRERLLLRCSACKDVKAVDLDYEARRERIGYGRFETRRYYVTKSGAKTNFAPEGWLPASLMVCCGLRRVAKRVVAHENKDHECDPRCMNATGPSCSCSCNGLNHGASWLVLGATS